MNRPAGDRYREAIIDSIKRLTAQQQRSPTFRDVCRDLDISSTGHLTYHIAVLRRQGVLSKPKGPHDHRCLKIIKP